MSPQDEAAAFEARVRERENLIAACMQEQGFDYELDLSDIEMRRFDREHDLFDVEVRGTREWSHCMADAGFPDIPHQSLVQSVWLDKAYPVEGAALQPGASHARMEIVMALADFDCRQAIGFDDREREIRVEVENQESVDALLALVQTVRPGS